MANNDPWVDEDTHVDLTKRAEDAELQSGPAPGDLPTYDPADFDINEEPSGSLREFLEAQNRPDPAPAPQAVAPESTTAAELPVSVQPDEPRVIQLEGGATVSVEHTKKGYRAVLSTGIEGVQPEVFYGATEPEMWQQIAAGKVNATKKIREQERRLKLEAAEEPPAPKVVSTPVARELSADDIFAIKTAMESNPDKGITEWFQRKFGVDPAQVINDSRTGAGAATELASEAVAMTFRSEHPEYWNTDYNRDTLVGYLSKQKLRVTLTAKNADDLMNRLIEEGHWTVKNLNDAYDELRSSGLLEFEPVEAESEPEPEPVAVAPVAQPVPAPAPVDERIARVTRRPRAAYGLPASAGSATRPTTNQPAPSVDDLDKLSDAEVNALFSGVRREALINRR